MRWPLLRSGRSVSSCNRRLAYRFFPGQLERKKKKLQKRNYAERSGHEDTSVWSSYPCSGPLKLPPRSRRCWGTFERWCHSACSHPQRTGHDARSPSLWNVSRRTFFCWVWRSWWCCVFWSMGCRPREHVKGTLQAKKSVKATKPLDATTHIPPKIYKYHFLSCFLDEAHWMRGTSRVWSS